MIKKNLISYLDWTFSVQGTDQFDVRLTQFLEFLSFWENQTRLDLYLPADVTAAAIEPNGIGLNPFYAHLTQDLDEVHARMAEKILHRLQREMTSSTQFATETFFRKELPYSLIFEKLYAQQNPGPMSLVHFTHLVLNSTLERAKFFLSLSNLACSLQDGCDENELTRSAIYSIFRLTSLVGHSAIDPAQWQEMLTATDAKTATTFRTILRNHPKLVHSLRIGMVNQAIAIEDADLEQFEPLVVPLIASLRSAQATLQEFPKRGQLGSQEKEYLGPYTGAEMTTVREGLTYLKNFLETQKTEYLRAKERLATSLQVVNEDHSRAAATSALIDSVGYELRMAQLDLESLQAALRSESGVLAQAILRSTNLFNQAEFRDRYGGTLVPVKDNEILTISAQDALFEPSLNQNNIEAIAVKNGAGPFILDLVKGDLVTAEVTGDYSPTCAIAKEYRDVVGIDRSKTGPEGFVVHASNRELHANSTTNSSGERHHESTNTNRTEYLEGCGSTSVGTSTSVGVSAGLKVLGIGVSVNTSLSSSEGRSTPEDCINKVKTASHSVELSQMDSRTNSRELTQNASFEAGMRSSFTPFPTAPVGALMAVEFDTDTQEIRRTRVVHRNSTFTAGEASRLVFVVNDCQNVQASPAALSVRISQKRSPLDAVKISFLMQTIADLSVGLDHRFRNFLQLGDVSSRDLDGIAVELKQLVNEKLQTGGHGFVRMSDLPLIDELIQTWIHSEVAQVERKIRIRQAERKIQLLYMKHRDLVNQTSNHQCSRFLNSLIADWSYQNLDYQAVLVGVERMVQYLNSRVIPLYNTIHPGVLRRASQELRNLLGRINLDTEPLELATALTAFVEELRFGTMMTAEAREQPGRIVISFPKTQGDNAKYRLEQGADGSMHSISDSSWASVPFEEASRVWNEFLSQSHQISFHVGVNDIYEKTGGRGRLHCNQRAPFIEGMAAILVLDRPEETQILNLLEEQRMILLPSLVQIPNIGRMENYRVISKEFSSDTIPIKFSGNGNQVLQTVAQSNAIAQRAARGMSPIGTFTLSGLTGFYSDEFHAEFLNHINEILLVFQYSALGGQRLDWIDKCK